MESLQTKTDCLSSLHKLLFHQQPPESKYWDATGKPGAGLYDGNLVWSGNYEECQSQDQGLYCLTNLHVPASSLLSQPTNNKSTLLHWGLCAVKSCNESTISQNIQQIISATLGLDKLQITSADVHCTRNVEYSIGFHVTLAVLAVLLVLCFIGTLIDLYHQYRITHIPKLVHRIDSSGSFLVNPDGSPDEGNPSSINDENVLDDASEQWNRPPNQERLMKAYKQQPGCFVRFWQCFSVRHNLVRLWAPGTPDSTVRCLHGLRVISMAWIILGHTFLGAFETDFMENPSFVKDYVRRFDGQIVANAYFAIDTFFFMSGLLVCYLTLKQMNQNDGRICLPRLYLHRYLRLTPNVALTMLLWIFVLPHFADGPLAYQLTTNSTCEKYWWTNLLFIQNFYPTNLDDVCMGWLWYIAVDMQFCLVSPFIIYVMYKNEKKGFGLIVLLLVATLSVTAVLLGVFRLEVNLTASVINGNTTGASAYENKVFDKPYCRFSPYLIGMLLGYHLYKFGGTRRRIPKIWVILNWIFCAVTMVGLVFGLYWTFNGYPMRLSGNILYGSLSHLLWAMALSWIVYCGWHGYAGVIEDALSWRLWEPLSKLTYSAYLVHPLLMFWHWKTIKTGFHGSDYFMTLMFCGFFTLTYVLAMVVHCIVERPVLNLEAFISKRK